MDGVARIRCLGCGRKVKDHPDAKLSHVMKYHPATPLKRIIGLFDVALFEMLGYRIGERLKGLL